ncbi:hypothetical protein BD770DRAFT_412840 [Pilaira anomala]|nr:hypothetical protein BD770DRAFT_412840 [Pilaira anomala]
MFFKKIYEFYVATEDNKNKTPTSLFNINTCDIYAAAFESRGLLFRLLRNEDKNGLCVKSPWKAQGELIVRIDDGLIKFDDYYKNKGATNKTILKNVFERIFL